MPTHRSSRAVRWLLTVLALAAMWYGFVTLGMRDNPQFDLTPTVSMLWLTFAALVAVSFPEVLKYIKSLKFAGIEFELAAAVEAVSEADVAETLESPLGDEAEKARYEELTRIIENLSDSPGKPVLLSIPVKTDSWLRSDMLFVYLTALNIYTDKLQVVFRVGDERFALPGRRALRLLTELLAPRWDGALDPERGQWDLVISAWLVALTGYGRKMLPGVDELLSGLWSRVVETRDSGIERIEMSRTMVKETFWGRSSRVLLRLPLQKADISRLREAIQDHKDIVMLMGSDGRMNVVPTCEIAERLSVKVLRSLTSR